jgi:hypothetical protein
LILSEAAPSQLTLPPLHSFFPQHENPMNERLQKIYSQHKSGLEEWYENIRYYQQHFVIPYDPGLEDLREEPTTDIEALLHRLMEIIIGYATKAGSWKLHETLDYRTGLRTGIICQQIDHAYFLGVDKHSIYLESPIAYPGSIHKMFDRFVHGIADYSRFGVFLLPGE